MRPGANLRLLAAVAVGLFAAAAAAQGATYVVDQNHPKAADTNPGTAAAPWKTIQHAAIESCKSNVHNENRIGNSVAWTNERSRDC